MNKIPILSSLSFFSLLLFGFNQGCNSAANIDNNTEILPEQKMITSPLRVSKENPRYFTDDSGKAIYLTGSHVWSGLQDISKADPPKPFDFEGYLDFLTSQNHNFIRLWRVELAQHYSPGDEAMLYAAPHPWLRSGPGVALDGKLKFDLSQFDQTYFDRLRARVISAGDRGIYVSIMLFEGWGLRNAQAPWRWDAHPFNRFNNVNNIDGDPNNDGYGVETHSLQMPAVVSIQEDYIKKVIETVNDLDNVLFEIANESEFSHSKDWQYHMINFIKQYEKSKPHQHPVGMTGYGLSDNSILYSSPADWISPGATSWQDNDPYKTSPPIDVSGKVIVLDTDHLWGIGGDRAWVWKSFTRGYNIIYMDKLEVSEYEGSGRGWDLQDVRETMGSIRSFAERMELKRMVPRSDLSRTGYCLAKEGSEYLVYYPRAASISESFNNVLFGRSAEVSLVKGKYAYEWFNPATRKIEETGFYDARDGFNSLKQPFDGDAVLYLRSE